MKKSVALKTTKHDLNFLFSNIECLDYKVILVIVSSKLESINGLWYGFPTIIGSDKLAEWKKVDMVLIGQRSTGCIAIEFEYKEPQNTSDIGEFVCLLSEKELKVLSKVPLADPMMITKFI